MSSCAFEYGYVNQFIALPNAMCIIALNIYTRKRNWGGNAWWEAEKFEILQIVINQSFVIACQRMLNLTIADYLLAAVIYTAYRSRTPDNATQECVRRQLAKNDIDVTKLAAFPDNNC
jgi:hypothetical protein